MRKLIIAFTFCFLMIMPTFLGGSQATAAPQDGGTTTASAGEIQKYPLPPGFRYLTERELAWIVARATSRERIQLPPEVLAPLNKAIENRPPGWPGHYPCGQHTERVCGGGFCFTVVVQEYCSYGFPDGEEVIQVLNNQ